MADLDTLINSLEQHVAALESGRESSSGVDTEAIYSLDTVEQQARARGYTLSHEEMLQATQMAPVFSDVVSRLSYQELEDRVLTARKEGNAVELYLLSRYCPHEELRSLAESLGADEATLSKVSKARSLYARVRQLEAVQPHERRELARALGHAVQEPQQGQSGADVWEQYQALQATGLYSL